MIDAVTLRNIKQAYEEDGMAIASIAQKYGIARQTIHEKVIAGNWEKADLKLVAESDVRLELVKSFFKNGLTPDYLAKKIKGLIALPVRKHAASVAMGIDKYLKVTGAMFDPTINANMNNVKVTFNVPSNNKDKIGISVDKE